MSTTDESVTRSEGYVSANGLNIYYASYGSGEPLLLLHGGTVTSNLWHDSIPFFAQHFRVITPDSRGHGKTNNPSGVMSYRLMADDVAAFIDALHLSKPLVYGFSDGGQIALELGMRYPGVARALVLSGVFFRFTDQYIRTVRGMGVEGPGVVNFEHIQNTMPDAVTFWQAEHATADNPERWKDVLKQISALWWTPLDYTATDFERIVDPTLIVQGDRDEFGPVTEVIDMYRMISKSELAIVPNAKHMAIIQPGGLCERVALDFFQRCLSPQP